MEEICRKLGVSEPTFIWWKKQLAGMGTVEIRSAQVVEVLDRLVCVRVKPGSLRVDNGSEFAGRLLDHRARLPKVPSGATGWTDETRGT